MGFLGLYKVFSCSFLFFVGFYGGFLGFYTVFYCCLYDVI